MAGFLNLSSVLGGRFTPTSPVASEITIVPIVSSVNNYTYNINGVNISTYT